MARPRKPGLIHLDTHVVCWLYAGRLDLPPLLRARNRFRGLGIRSTG
jgi:hypothetical protein